ncbi:uncharacterized protein LOC125725073 [Brienomyrus brachyistius]|uniref:uncharacterized protein LOC125725073 n=1 Tax=Brienomyrus brachyistius TaxID=42636 RepID=UPI0020B3D498|nr:uncharacterized protein LOC125725073 [Brienomyrus brachyistius]
MMARKRMLKAVDWTDDDYWAAWDKWHEVIDWEDDTEECSPERPPSDQAQRNTSSTPGEQRKEECSPPTPTPNNMETCIEANTCHVEVVDLNRGTIRIQLPKHCQDQLQIEALLLDICQVELQNLNHSEIQFEIEELDIGEVVVDGTQDGATSTFEVEIVDIKVEVADKEWEHKVKVESPPTLFCEATVEEVGLDDPDTGKVVVSACGTVVNVPLPTTCGRRKRKKKKRRRN